MRVSVIVSAALLLVTQACGGPAAPAAPTGTPTTDADAGSGEPPRSAGPVHSCALGAGPLSEAARASVERALAGERRAELVYDAAIAELGASTPLRRIARAERRHSAALEALLAAHGHPVPAPEKTAVKGPADLATACRAGAGAEKDVIALYEKELGGAIPADVQCVFEHLQHASRDHHLPSFERCVSR